MTPARIADLVFEAMETGQFYILADNPEDLGYVKMSGAVRYQVGDRRTHHLMGVLREFLGPNPNDESLAGDPGGLAELDRRRSDWRRRPAQGRPCL